MAGDDAIARFMENWLRPGDCVFDVGANWGAFLFPLLDLIGEQGSLHAFEPNPELAADLRRRGAGRPLTVNATGLSDHVGQAEFFLDVREGGRNVASSLEKLNGMHGTEHVRNVSIPLTTLDAYCNERGLSPQFIKIDVEGHELPVFRGAVETINRCRPFLIFEFWETWWNFGVRQIFEYLNREYVLVRVQDGVVVNDWYYQHQGQGTVDIDCIPVARASRIDMLPELLAANSVS